MRMPGFARLSVLVFVFTLFAFAQGAWAQPVIIAEDNSGNYDELDPWVDQSNGGTGFGPWNFDVNENSEDENEEARYYAGAFISDPASAGVSGFGPEAFGLYANPGDSPASILISRDFDAELETNQVFSLQWAVNWDTDTANRKGFRIYNDDTQLLEVSMNGYPGPVEIDHGDGFEDTEIEYGTGPMTWRIRMVDATTLQVTSTGRDGTPPVVYSTNITVSAAPDSFAIFTGAMTSGNQRQPYYNNFVIYEGPDPDALMITGSDAIFIGQTNTLMLHRSAGVGNEITLSNSNLSAVSVPANVEFDPGAPTVAFDIVGLDTGSAELQAFGDVATSAVFAVTVIAMPEPPEDIYDDATFYPLGWSDGDNGGNGFNVWVIASDAGNTQIADASAQGSNSGAINTDDVAFRLAATGFVNAGRTFETALNPGDVFTFSLAYRNDNGNKGFNLMSGGNEVFNFNIEWDALVWSGGGSAGQIPWEGARENGAVLEVEVTATGAGFSVSVTSPQDATLNAGGTFTSNPIDGFELYVSGTDDTENDNALYANMFQVEPSTDDALFLSGPSSVYVGSTNVYTLFRVGDVHDLIFLESSNDAVLEVPASVTFTNGNIITFDAVALSLGTSVVTATASDFGAQSEPLTVTVTEAPEPPEGIYDEASYYTTGTWITGSNEGSGFDEWTLTGNDGGHFVWAAGNQGPNSAALDTEDLSFGMWANAGGSANARRSFLSALNTGDVFTFQMAICWDNGNRGFDLFADEGQVFNFNINDAGYSWTGAGSAPATTWDGIRENGLILEVEITATETGFDFSITSPNDGGTLNATGSVISDPVDEFQFYVADAPGDDDRKNLYFNRLMVVTDDEPPEPPDIDQFNAGIVAGMAEASVYIGIGESGVNYILEYTTDLTEDPQIWQVADSEFGDDSSEITLIDFDPPETMRIYRLRLEY